MKRIPEEIRINQINARPAISFVRWVEGYFNCESKALCRCEIDGFEWPARVMDLARGKGCPQCAGKRRWTADERIKQINSRHNIEFIRWGGPYTGCKTKAIVRCVVDGFEWSASVDNLVITGTSCPQCSGRRRWTSDERIAQINSLPNSTFVRWEGGYRNCDSKAICHCDSGHEWSASLNNLINKRSGCPSCAESGYNPSKQGVLYLLRSECGAMVKIGISNDIHTRHRTLRRETPFPWSCIAIVKGDGYSVAAAEKELHSNTEPVEFNAPFNGYTEWRKWDDRLPMWVSDITARIAAGVAR